MYTWSGNIYAWRANSLTKQGSHSPLQYQMESSGYEANFVEQPSKLYECPVCLLVLREPYLLSCCGIKVCHPCITRIQNTTDSASDSCACPLCRKTFNAMLDKQLHRLILGFTVYCPLNRNGCNWIGELRHLNEHTDNNSLVNGCQFVEVPCRNSCGNAFPKHALLQHEKETCMNRVNRPIKDGIENLGTILKIRQEILKEVTLKYDERVSQLEESIKIMHISYNQRITQLESEVKKLNDILTEKEEGISKLEVSSKHKEIPHRSHSLSNPDVKGTRKCSQLGHHSASKTRSFSCDTNLLHVNDMQPGTDHNDGFIFSPGFNDEVTAKCRICQKLPTDRVVMNCCGTAYCNACLETSCGLLATAYCPMCKAYLRPIRGNQPLGTMKAITSKQSLPGYPRYGTITISYSMPGGKQGPEHPNPGQNFSGTTCTAYLPNNDEGRKVLQLLKRAFDAGLVFTIGTSASGKKNTVVWNDIPHMKTSTHGGPTNHGYPDDTYLKRISIELKANGIY